MDNYQKAYLFKSPDYVPVFCNFLPSTWMKYKEELSSVVEKYPELFKDYDRKNHDYNSVYSNTYHEGTHTDAWGCVWSNIKEGMEAIVTGHPLPNREDINNFKAPSFDAGIPHGFMYLRLQDLRGFEELMIDFAEEPEELSTLVDIVCEYNVDQVEKWLKREPDREMFNFGDDLGMQHSLPMNPEKWRKYLKPAFHKIYKPLKDVKKYIYMHTDGHILEIIPDLCDCGVDVINPQFRANGIDNLVRACKGKVAVSLDLDRQLFPFCTPSDIYEHVYECISKLGSKEGGLIISAECADDIPLGNIDAICGALVKYRTYFN